MVCVQENGRLQRCKATEARKGRKVKTAFSIAVLAIAAVLHGCRSGSDASASIIASPDIAGTGLDVRIELCDRGVLTFPEDNYNAYFKMGISVEGKAAEDFYNLAVRKTEREYEWNFSGVDVEMVVETNNVPVMVCRIFTRDDGIEVYRDMPIKKIPGGYIAITAGRNMFAMPSFCDKGQADYFRRIQDEALMDNGEHVLEEVVKNLKSQEAFSNREALQRAKAK